VYAPPKLEFINDKLSDLLDERAHEIYHLAKKQNKKITVMWSGGIDSTLVLTALLKNIPYNEQPDLLSVTLNTTSILENTQFFLKFISKRLKITSSTAFVMSPEILKKNIILHGDPADCLFGPSTPKYKEFIAEGIHKEPWKKHQQRMIQSLEPTKSTYGWELPGLANWFITEVSNNIKEVGVDDYVSTVSDWWWWTYFNFKWACSCVRPFFNYREEPYAPISYSLQKDYAETTFFNTPKFNLWTYSNLKTLIPDNLINHKREAKQYIFEFDHNKDYFEYKPKLGTVAPSLLRKLHSPMFFDSEWRPVSFWYANARNTVSLMNQYFNKQQ
jgi:hypothetical protein